MTDNTQPEALRLADELAQRWGENMACPELDAAAELRRQHARIAELEAQLEAIGAGGVSGPLMGEQSAPKVSDAQRALHELILNRLSHAELLEKAHYLMELNSNQGRTISELQDLAALTAQAPSQPGGFDAGDMASAAEQLFIPAGWNKAGGGNPPLYTAAQVAALRTAHVQNPAEIEHVVGDVSKNGVKLNMTQPAPAAVAGPSEAVAYLDIGTGGYLDLGTDLADEALSRLPKGRHALVIAGTYGIYGYTAASTPQSAPPPQAAPAGVLEDAARWHWMAEYIVGTRTDLDDELIASATVDELRKMVDADLAARKQGASHD